MTVGNVTVTFTGNTKSLERSLKRLASSFSDMGAKTARSSKVATRGFRDVALGMHIASRGIDSLVGRYVNLYAVIRTGTRLFKRSFMAVENFNNHVIQTAALWTSFSKDLGERPIGDIFNEAIESSQKLQETFIQINARTAATINQMGMLNRTLATYDVKLDASNKKQMDSFVTLSNAIAIVTAGAKDMNKQMSQEMRSVLEGRARDGSTLALILKGRLGGAWKDLIKMWKKDGVLLEKLAEQFKGIDAASLKLQGTWAIVGSTFQSMIDNILRLGFEDIFKEIVSLIGDLNGYLLENADLIARNVNVQWKKLKKVFATMQIVDLNASLETNLKYLSVWISRLKKAFEILVSFKIISSITFSIWGLSMAFKALADVLGLLNSYGAVGLVSKIFGIGISASIAAGVIAITASFWGLYKAKKKLHDLAVQEALSKDKELINLTEQKLTVEKEIVNIEKRYKSKTVGPSPNTLYGANPLLDKTLSQRSIETDIEYANNLKRLKEIQSEIDIRMKALGISLLLPGGGKGKPDPTKDSKISYETRQGNLAGKEASAYYGSAAYDSMREIQALQDKEKEDQLKRIGRAVRSLRDEWTDAFALMADSTKSFGDKVEATWVSMRDAVVDMATQMIAKMLATLAIQALLSAVSGGLSMAGFASMATAVSDISKGLKSYAVGTMNVPSDQLANIHQGEIIIPKTFSDDIRAGRASLGGDNKGIMSAMLGKLDTLIDETAANRVLDMGEAGMVEFTKGVNNTNYRLGYMGV